MKPDKAPLLRDEAFATCFACGMLFYGTARGKWRWNLWRHYPVPEAGGAVYECKRCRATTTFEDYNR